MKKESINLKMAINALDYPKANKSDLATKILYLASTANAPKEKFELNLNSIIDIVNSNAQLKRAYYSVVKYSNYSKTDFREINNACIKKFKYGSYINDELYSLVGKLLNLSNSDLLVHINAQDDNFLIEAIKETKNGALNINTFVLPDNKHSKDIIYMRSVISNSSYKIIDSIDQIKKFRPNKVFINPVYNLIDKNYKYSTKQDAFWNDLATICKTMSKEFRIVALVPNTMLSSLTDKEKREELLSNKFIEGIISLPLRYYSNSLKVETSLLVLSNGNEKVKFVDINNKLTTTDIKAAKLKSITDYIFESYLKDFSLIDISTLIKNDSNLQITNFIFDDVYDELNNPVSLSMVADISKRTKKTKIDFSEVIDQSGESPYCIISSVDINDGIIDYNNLTQILYDSSLDEQLAQNGDVILTNKSSKIKCAVINNEKLKLIPIGSMIVISPHKGVLDGMYLKMFFESKRGQEILLSVKRGDKTTILYPKDLGRIKIPCIPYNKQIELSKQYKEMTDELIKKKSEYEKIIEKINELVNKGETNYGNNE